MTNPNPFTRSPLDSVADDLNAQALDTLSQIPKPATLAPLPAGDAPEQPAGPADERAPSIPVAEASRRPAARNPKAGSNLPPPDLHDLFEASATAYGVPVNVLMAMGQQESGYTADAVGQPTKYGRALGIMQFLGSNADHLGINPMDPNEAVPAAARQLRERLDKGASMEDAVMEHFAGPDRKQWGEKTKKYGTDVMAKVAKIGDELAKMPPPAAPTDPAGDPNKMSAAMPREQYAATFRANNPQASDDAVNMALAQYDTDKAARGAAKVAGVQDKFDTLNSPEKMFAARLDAKLAAKQKGGVVPALPSMAQGPLSDESQGMYKGAPEPVGMGEQAGRDLARGGRNLQALAYGATALGADLAGLDDTADQLLGRYVEISNNNLRDNPAAIGSYKNVGSLGDAGKYALESLLENAPMILPSLVTGGLGAMAARKAAEKVVGGMIAKQLGEGITRDVAEKNAAAFVAKRVMMGSAAGAAPSSIGMETGNIYGDNFKDTGEKRAGVALAYGIPAGLLDVVEPVLALRKIVGPAADELAGTVMRRLGKEAGKQFLAEAVTEGGQTVLEQLAARHIDGKEKWTPAMRDDIIDSMLKGGIGGAGMGAMSHGVSEARSAMDTPARQVAREINRQVGEVNFTGIDDAVRAGMDPNNEAVDPRDTVKPRATPPTQNAPLPPGAAPAPSSGNPLADAATEAIQPAARVVVTDDAGNQKTGTVAQYHEATDGQFQAQIVDDDGNVTVITDRDGNLHLAPVENDRGPMATALDAAAGGAPHADLTVQAQAEAAAMQPTDEKAAPASAATPITTPEVDHVPGNGPDDVGGRSSGNVVQTEPSDGAGSEGAGPVPIVGRDDAAGSGKQDAADPAGASAPTDTKPALTADKPEWESNPYMAYRATDAKVANAYMDKHKIDRKQFEVMQTGQGRFEIKPRAESAPAAPDHLAAADAKHAKQDEAVRVAAENIAKRKAEKVPEVAPSAELAGDKINKQWTAFADDSGTLNIDRADMPQVKAEHRGALVQFLKARGIAHKQMEVAPGKLKPTQREFSPAKVQKAKDYVGGDRSILVSSDGHVLDGHHQWLAKLDSGEKVPVIRLNAPIKRLLAEVKQFPSAETAAGVAQPSAQPSAPAAEEKAASAPRKPAKRNLTAKQKAAQLADYYAPGNVTKSYNGHDRVLAYSATEGGTISVKVQAVKKEGDQWVALAGPDGAVRTHATRPEARDLAAGPVARAEADAAPAKVEYPANYTGKDAAMHEGQKAVVDFMNGKIDKAALIDRLAEQNLPEGVLHSITNRVEEFRSGDVNKVLARAEAAAAEPKFSVSGTNVTPIQRRIQSILYGDRSTILGKNGELDADRFAVEEQLTDKEFTQMDDWKNSVVVPLNAADTKTALAHVNGMEWHHGSTITDLDKLGLQSAGGLFLTSDPVVAQHYGSDQGRVYGTAVNVRKPFFVATSDLTADMESSGEIASLKAQGFDAIVPLDYADMVILSDSALKPGTKFSVKDGKGEQVAGTSIGSLAGHLGAGPLGSAITHLIDSGAVQIHSTPATLPGKAADVAGVQALTMPDGTIHLVAGNLTTNNAQAVLLHEAFHAGAEKLVGTKQWDAMMARMGSLYQQGKGTTGAMNKFWDAARARVATAAAKGAVAPAMTNEEFAAYAIEEYESAPATLRKWVDDLVGMVKAWAQARFGKQLGDVTPAQLSALARMALADAASGRGAASRLAPVMSTKAARTIEVDGVRRPIEDSRGRQLGQGFAEQQAFWRWFQDSKAVDPQGRPLVAYHGTTAGDFSAFKNSEQGSYGDGIYFATGHDAANEWAGGMAADENGGATPDGSAVYQAYLRIENPASAEIAEGLEAKHGGKTRAELKRLGYDGVIADDGEMMALDPEQVKSATGNSGAFDGDNKDIRYSTAGAPVEPSYTPEVQGKLRQLQASAQDNMNRVKQAQRKIEQVTGTPIKQQADYYLAETNRPGRVAARIEDGIDHMFDPLMEKLAKSGFKPEQLEELLHAQHASERNESVSRINPDNPEGSGMSDKKAEGILKRYEGAEFAGLHELADQVRAITKATMDLKLAYGLVTPERYAELADHYEFYVPLKGDGEYGVAVKQAMGHDERAEHILPNVMRDYKQAVVAGEKNLARQVLLRMVLQYPDAKLWTVGMPAKGRYVAGKVYDVFKGAEKVASFGSKAEVTAFMEQKKGEAVNYRVLDSTGMQVAEFTKQLQDNEVMVYIAGQPVRVQIHDETLAKQLRPMDHTQMNMVQRGAADLNRYYSKIYTGYNPEFILRNFARDSLTGTINMMGNHGSVTAAKAWGHYPAAWYAMLKWAATKKIPAGRAGDMLREYRDNGGKVGASWMGDLEAQADTLQSMYDNHQGVLATATTGSARRTGAVAWHKSVGKLAHIVEVLNQAFENALRLALYTQLRNEGSTPAKAAQGAKSVTVDFDRRGTATGALSAAYLFFNPAVQGTANLAKTLAQGKNKGQAWAALGALSTLGYLLGAMGMDNDKDKWLGEKWGVRSKNFILNVGGKQIRIPVSQEYAPFYSFGLAMAEAGRGEDKAHSALRVASSFVDAYVPFRGVYDSESDNHAGDAFMSVVPTLLQMPAQIGFNRNSFGSQIVPESAQTKDRPDNLKMNRSTKGTPFDKAAQGIAAAGDAITGAGKYENSISKVSPETLKLLWANFTGGLGTFITDSIGLAQLAASDAPMAVGDFPIAKSFVRDPNVKPMRSRYFDVTHDARMAIDEYKQAVKAGDDAEADKVANDPSKAMYIGMTHMIEANRKASAALRDQAVDINADPALTTGQKRIELKKLEDDEESLYREAIKAFQQ